MKKLFSSIRFRVWLMFICFALAIIAFLYIFQVIMLDSYYEYMKTQETINAVEEIDYVWNNNPDKISSIVKNLADENRMFIRISDTNRVYVSSNSIDRNNREIDEILRNLDKSEINEALEGESLCFTTTLPRSDFENKAIVMISRIADAEDKNGVFKTSGDVLVYVINHLEPIGTTASIIFSQLALTSAIIILVAFILSFFFSTGITKPIVRISQSALRLPQGEFDLKPARNQFYEINELTEALGNASEEIAKSDNLRKELMANISHDLRTPLTMIKAYAEMIRDLSGDNPEKREKHLQVIIDETDRLSSLVTDILDLSKLQSGVSQMNMTEFNISEHLRNLVSRFSLLNETKDYRVVLNCEEGIVIKADATKLDQVIYNFINNAITYTGDDKTVTVNLYRISNGKARFEVCDSGMGIAKEDLKYVWDRYYKVKNSGETHKRAKKGSGLGLSIVKGVLELHNFSYGADSEVGKGSVFWFEFPLSHD